MSSTSNTCIQMVIPRRRLWSSIVSKGKCSQRWMFAKTRYDCKEDWIYAARGTLQNIFEVRSYLGSSYRLKWNCSSLLQIAFTLTSVASSFKPCFEIWRNWPWDDCHQKLLGSVWFLKIIFFVNEHDCQDYATIDGLHSRSKPYLAIDKKHNICSVTSS